jgi:hypothetical protein
MQKSKTFRAWTPEQTALLLPPARKWLAEDHQVSFLLFNLIDELDLSAILIPTRSLRQALHDESKWQGGAFCSDPLSGVGLRQGLPELRGTKPLAASLPGDP